MKKIILIVVSFLVITNLFAQQEYKFCTLYSLGLGRLKIDTGSGPIILNSVYPDADNYKDELKLLYFMQSKGWEFISVDHSLFYFRKRNNTNK